MTPKVFGGTIRIFMRNTDRDNALDAEIEIEFEGTEEGFSERAENAKKFMLEEFPTIKSGVFKIGIEKRREIRPPISIQRRNKIGRFSRRGTYFASKGKLVKITRSKIEESKGERPKGVTSIQSTVRGRKTKMKWAKKAKKELSK